MRTTDGDHGDYGDKAQPIKMLSCTTKFQQLHLQKTPTPEAQETFQKRERFRRSGKNVVKPEGEGIFYKIVFLSNVRSY